MRLVSKKGALYPCCLILLLGLLLSPIKGESPSSNATKKVKIQATNTYYQEASKLFIASGNVKLLYGNVSIEAPKLVFDTVANQVRGTGNITITRGDDQFNSNYIFYDLKKNTIKLSNIHIAIEPPDGKAPIYLRAEEIIDYDTHKVGKNGIFSTCEFEHPHYYIRGKQFKYYPDKRIIGQNVFVYAPILFVPFGFWTPIYLYELGERKVVWNFPAIGEKKTAGWGWFMQNTIDYNNINGEDSSVFVDLFQNKGIGLGVRHQYLLPNNQQGSIYYYKLKERDNGDISQKKSWTQTLSPIEPLTLKLDYTEVDAIVINGNSRNDNVKKSVDIKYSELNKNDSGLVINSNIEEFNNFRSKQDTLKTSYEQKLNNFTSIKANLNKTLSHTNQTETYYSDLTYTKRLRHNGKLTQKFNYNSKDKGGDELDPDKLLKYYLTYTNPLTDTLSFTLNVNRLFDLDEDRVTSDSQSGDNNFLYKEPEIILNYTPKFNHFTFNQKTTIARYQEVRYNSSDKKQRIFPENQYYTVDPNTYIFNTSVKKTISGLPFDTTYTLNLGYDQYLFKAENTSITEGDAAYSTSLSLTQSSDFFKFIKFNTTYTTVGAPDENNSPYFAFDNDIQKQNKVSPELIFYLINPSKYKWSHETSYNWITHKWTDYLTRLDINPNKLFRFEASTGKNINPNTDSERNRPYRDLNTTLTLNLPNGFELDHTLNLDLNKQLLDDEFYISQAYFDVKFTLFTDPFYKLQVSGSFDYDTDNQNNDYDVTRYQMQTLSLIKKEHRRTLKLQYNKRREEYKFEYIIDAFPKDSIGFKKTKEVWKIEGILDDKSQERF